jgi:hypothetical protein
VESWVAANPVIIGKEKIVIMGYDFPFNYSYYTPGYYGVHFYIFDIATQTLTTSERSDGLGGETESYLAYDKESNFLYFLDSPYCLDGYNMATGEFHYNIFSTEPSYDYTMMLMCDKNNTYIVTDIDMSIYRANGSNYPVFISTLPTTSNTFYFWHYCFVLDGEQTYFNEPSVVWWDENTYNLYRTSIYGTNLANYDSLGIIPTTNGSVFVIHLGDCFAVMTYGFREPIDYYLIT